MICKFINISIYKITEDHLVAVSQTKNDHISQQTFFGLEDALKMSSTRLQRNNFTSSKTSWRTKNCYAEDVLKTSWRHVLKMSWRHVLKTSRRHVLKASWRHVLKMSWRHILNTSSRHYEDKQNTYWGSVSSKSDCVSNKSIFQKFISDISKANPKCIN